jgi:hypothetical protein
MQADTARRAQVEGERIDDVVGPGEDVVLLKVGSGCN